MSADDLISKFERFINNFSKYFPDPEEMIKSPGRMDISHEIDGEMLIIHVVNSVPPSKHVIEMPVSDAVKLVESFLLSLKTKMEKEEDATNREI